MHTEGISPSSVANKIGFFYALIILDIVCNTGSMITDLNGNAKESGERDHDINKGLHASLSFACTGLQLVIQFCMIFWYFFLVWKTFLFKQKFWQLFKEVPFVIISPLLFVIFLIERGYRMSVMLGGSKLSIIEIYDDALF